MKEYLGDSVYVDIEGDTIEECEAIVLTTENDAPDDRSNMIVLDPNTCRALVRYMHRLGWIRSDDVR